MKRDRKLLLTCVVLLAALCSLGCDEPPAAPTPVNVTVNVNNNNQQGGGSAGATPSPSPGTQGFDSVRIGIFQHNAGCANAPRNGEQIVRLGCTASLTATPKLGGTDVPPAVHGPSCIWFLNGTRVDALAQIPQVDISVDPNNPFNVSARGKAAGQFRLSVEVKGFRTGDSVFAVE